jgi:hypothetical protein
LVAINLKDDVKTDKSKLSEHISRLFRGNPEILKMHDQTKRKRPKSRVIRTIEEKHPWVLISQAAKESGLTDLLIRNSGITSRPFGTAYYIRPADLNAWINGDGEKGLAS